MARPTSASTRPRSSFIAWAHARQRRFFTPRAPGEAFFTGPVDGAELLVLDGEVVTGDQSCKRGSWIRLPPGEYPEIVAGEQGVTLYIRTGDLSHRAMGA